MENWLSFFTNIIFSWECLLSIFILAGITFLIRYKYKLCARIKFHYDQRENNLIPIIQNNKSLCVCVVYIYIYIYALIIYNIGEIQPNNISIQRSPSNIIYPNKICPQNPKRNME